MSATYTKGTHGLPVPVVGGVKRVGAGRFKHPAAGLVLLECVPSRKGLIHAPSQEAESNVSTWRIIAVGSETYVPPNTGAALPFPFVAGEEVILRPGVTRSDGSYTGPVLYAEPNGPQDEDGNALRVLCHMHEVFASVYGSEDTGQLDA